MRSSVKLQLLISLLIVFGYAIPAKASNIISDNFASFNTGAVVGQDSWFTDSSAGMQITTFGSTNYLTATNTTARRNWKTGYDDFSLLSSTTIASQIYTKETSSGQYLHRLNVATTTTICEVGYVTGNDLVVYGLTESKIQNVITANELFTIYADYNFQTEQCRARLVGTNSTTTAWVSFQTSPVSPVDTQSIEMKGASVANPTYVKTVYTSQINNQQTYTGCETCTRIVLTDPGQEVVSSSYSRDYFIDYYVASEDFVSSSETFIELYYTHALSYPTLPSGYNIYTETFRSNVPSTGLNTAIFNLANTYATGTYNVSIRIYNEDQPSWWEFWKDTEEIDVLRYSTYFHVNTWTTADEIAQERQNAEESSYFTNWGDAPTVKNFIDGYLDTILHGAPIGYATRIVEIMTATSSTSTNLSITHSFPSTSPAYGKSITLDLTGAADNAYAQIGESYGYLMNVWQFVWYALLIFWIIKEFLGIDTQTEELKGTGGHTITFKGRKPRKVSWLPPVNKK